MSLLTPIDVVTVPEPRPARPLIEPPDFVVNAMAVGIVALPLLRPELPANSAPADLFMLIGVALTTFWVARTAVRVHAPYAVPVTLTVMAGSIGPILRLTRVNGVTLSVVLVQELWLLFFAGAVFNLARTPRALARLLHAWCGAGLFWVAMLYVGLSTGTPFLTGITARTGERVALTLGDSNYCANYFLVSLMLIIACGWPRRRWLRWVGCTALVIGVFLTGSNGGMISMIFSLSVVAFTGTQRRWGAMAALGLSAALSLGVLWSAMSCNGVGETLTVRQACVFHPTHVVDMARHSDIRQLKDSVGRANQSVGQRGELIGELTNLSLSAPITGLGPQSTRQTLIQSQVPFAKEAHNDYLGAIVERGPLGIAAIAVLFVSVVFRVLPVFNRPERSVLDPILPRPEGLVLALVVMAAAGWFYEILHTRHLWALLALAAAAGRVGLANGTELEVTIPRRRPLWL